MNRQNEAHLNQPADSRSRQAHYLRKNRDYREKLSRQQRGNLQRRAREIQGAQPRMPSCV